MVELALQRAQALVGQPADVAPAQQLLALGVDDRAPQPQRRLVLRGQRDLAGLGVLQQVQPAAGSGPAGRAAARGWRAIALVVDVVVLLGLQLVEPAQGGLDRRDAGLVAQPRLVGLRRRAGPAPAPAART